MHNKALLTVTWNKLCCLTVALLADAAAAAALHHCTCLIFAVLQLMQLLLWLSGCLLLPPPLLLLLQILILPIPPLKPSHRQAPSAKLEDLLELSDDVAGFNVMTYDYSYGRAGPNGPLPWQEENVQEMMGDEPDPDEDESDRTGGEQWLFEYQTWCWTVVVEHWFLRR
jgi:hypothetical protein